MVSGFGIRVLCLGIVALEFLGMYTGEPNGKLHGCYRLGRCSRFFFIFLDGAFGYIIKPRERSAN